MAQAKNNSLFFQSILVLALVLFISVAESRNFGFKKEDATLITCDSVYGADSGDTCSIVAQAFGLSLQDFLAINPNINCDGIFVGQWLCLKATT